MKTELAAFVSTAMTLLVAGTIFAVMDAIRGGGYLPTCRCGCSHSVHEWRFGPSGRCASCGRCSAYVAE